MSYLDLIVGPLGEELGGVLEAESAGVVFLDFNFSLSL